MKAVCALLNVCYLLGGMTFIVVCWAVAWDIFKPLPRR
jgi:hypothetical protein